MGYRLEDIATRHTTRLAGFTFEIEQRELDD